jgi:hypothetical protein
VRYPIKLKSGSAPGQDLSLTLKMQKASPAQPAKSCSSAPKPLTIFAILNGNHITPGPLDDAGSLIGAYSPEYPQGTLLVLSGYQGGPVSWAVSPAVYPGYLQASVTPDEKYPQFALLNYWITDPSTWGSHTPGAVTFSVTAKVGGVSSDPFQLILTDPEY